MEQIKEELLVLAAQQGNFKAFNLLYKRYQAPLLRFAYKLCGDQQIAQDAVQEAWLKCSKTLKRLQDPRAFKSWIYRAVRWRTIDQVRKYKLKEISLDTQTAELSESSSEPGLEFEQKEELSHLLKQLPEVEQQAIHLFYLEELKLSEIAIVLEVAVGTVKSRLNRARTNLRNQLKTE